MSMLRAKTPSDPDADPFATFSELDSDSVGVDSEILPTSDSWLERRAVSTSPSYAAVLTSTSASTADAIVAPESDDDDDFDVDAENGSAPRSRPHRIRLGNRYELIKRLGGGAEGTVWRARDLGLTPRDVAVKLINVQDPRRVERLRLEAARLSRLRSAGLPPVLDYGESPFGCFYVMPLIDGWTLSQAIQQRWHALRRQADSADDRASEVDLDHPAPKESVSEGDREIEPSRRPIASLPWKAYHLAVAGLMARVARALDEAHRHRIAHCDVKPNNILLDRDRPDEVYLADFGLAREPDRDKDERQDSHRQGTLVYMAPEKLRSSPDRNEFLCDIYSLGATLYEAATCFKPRSIPDSMPMEERLRLVSERPQVRPRRIRKEIPRDLERIILKAMSPNPGDRYASPQEFADDLDRFREGSPPLAARWHRLRFVWREATSRFWALLALAAAVALVASVAGGWREHERIRGHSRDFALANAQAMASELRFEDAIRELETAWSLNGASADPGVSANADAAARAVAGSLLDAMSRARNRGDYRDAQRLHETWRRLAALDPDVDDDARFRPNSPFDSAWIGSEPPGATVLIHHVREDGRPKPGAPFLKLQAGSLSQPAEISNLVPGPYWVTAFAPNGDAFVERPWELPPVSKGRGAVDPASPDAVKSSRSLRLYPKRTADLARTMIAVRSGTLEMGGEGAGAAWQAISPHSVAISEFLLDDRETTYRDFHRFLDQTGRPRTLAPWVGAKAGLEERPPENWLDWPVTNIPHSLALEYAAWRGCRLPLEEELEWAGRGDAGLVFPKDYSRAELDEPGQWRLRAVGSDRRDRSELVSERPLFDLWGNASEFALFDYRPYPNAPSSDVFSSRRHVARAGLWVRADGSVRMARLGFLLRGETNRGNVNPCLGFRCARSLRSWRGSDSASRPSGGLSADGWGAP